MPVKKRKIVKTAKTPAGPRRGTPGQVPAIWTGALLAWYRRHRRDLPWRRTRDPYAIWVSEIMLQQTTVEAVIPYYERFLERFPTVKDLASANLEEVLRFWSGLGYYSRARNLHRAAGMVVGARFPRPGRGDPAPTLPDTVEELMELPGIGRYTAGAVASIAFGRRAPVVDGNVVRVLSRLYAIGFDPKSPEGRKTFWKKAEDVLPHRDCGDFNQALMELGARICTPTSAACHLCPISTACRARKRGRVGDFPRGKRKIVYKDVLLAAAVVRRGNSVLFVRRSQKGLLKGLWEIPMVEGDLASGLKGWPFEVLGPLRPVRHGVLNRRLTIRPYLCHWSDGKKWGRPHKWINVNNISNLPMSSMNRKILSGLTSAVPGGRRSDKDSRPRPS